MRKLLDEKHIFCKMSNIKLKESNMLFSKAENDSLGACERASCNSRSSGISGVQKRRHKCEEKHKGSIDTNISVKNSSNFEHKSKPKNKVQSMQVNNETACACNSPEYPYFLYQQCYNGIRMNWQHNMYSSHVLNNGFNMSNCFVMNPFSRSLSESAVPCQQLSNMCFNSYKDRNGALKIDINKSSSNMSVKGKIGIVYHSRI